MTLSSHLSREGPPSVRAPPSVGVDDDLPPGEAGVAHGAADHEVAAGVDVVLGLEKEG